MKMTAWDAVAPVPRWRGTAPVNGGRGGDRPVRHPMPTIFEGVIHIPLGIPRWMKIVLVVGRFWSSRTRTTTIFERDRHVPATMLRRTILKRDAAERLCIGARTTRGTKRNCSKTAAEALAFMRCPLRGRTRRGWWTIVCTSTCTSTSRYPKRKFAAINRIKVFCLSPITGALRRICRPVAPESNSVSKSLSEK